MHPKLFTYTMLIVGLVLIVMYFTIDKASDANTYSNIFTMTTDNTSNPSDDDSDAIFGRMQTFDHCKAGLLTFGTLLFVLSAVAIKNETSSKAGGAVAGSYRNYMILMTLVGIVVISLASVAMGQLGDVDDAKKNNKDPDGKDSTVSAQLTTVIVLGSAVTLFGAWQAVAAHTGHSSSLGFGFDFEF